MVRFRTIKTFALGLGCSLTLNVALGDGFLGELSPTKEKPTAPQTIEASQSKAIDSEAGIGDTGNSTVPETIHERYADRAIKIERQVVLDNQQNYVNHGTWKSWSPKGDLLGEGKYRSGQREGTWIRYYYEAGEGQALNTDEEQPTLFSGPSYQSFAKPFQSVAHFGSGKLMGAWSITDGEGRPICSWEFNDDQLHGKATWYFPTGAKRREVHFEHGALNGDWSEWNEKGEVVAKDIYISGRKLEKIVDFYEGGEKRLEGFHLLANEQMEFSHDWWNGNVDFNVANVSGDDQKHGHWTIWAQNGGKIYDGEFDCGLADGRHLEWHANGQKKSDGVYLNGQRDGRWIWWHDNGIKELQGQFAAGNEIGTWLKWLPSGRLESKELRTQSQTVQVSVTQVKKSTSETSQTTTASQQTSSQPARIQVREATDANSKANSSTSAGKTSKRTSGLFRFVR